jgi:hypothetical protein
VKAPRANNRQPHDCLEALHDVSLDFIQLIVAPSFAKVERTAGFSVGPFALVAVAEAPSGGTAFDAGGAACACG